LRRIRMFGTASRRQRPSAIVTAAPLMLLLIACPAARAADEGDLAAEIVKMTGARTKIVWAHKVAGSKRAWGGNAPEFELMGFDTAEGKPRVILPGPASYGNPSITQDGSRVVFTDAPSRTVYVVDWDGKNKKALVQGFALCTWIHPKTGVQWVYASPGEFGTPISRYRLDKPEVKEVVWSNVCSCSNGWQVSADGTRMGSEFPHPNAGVAVLPNGAWKRYGGGCEGCIAPDNSYRFFHMGESAGHSGVMMYDGGGTNKRMVPFNNFPGRGRQDSWNPRWSTDVRFLTVSSPNAGGSQEVYLGEFDAEFTRVKRWIQISNRPEQDLCSHAWIAKGLGYYSGEVPFTVQIPPSQTPKGKWTWAFGDGRLQVSAGVKHTYTEPGTYTITARQGEVVLKGTVHVMDRKAPGVASVRVLDNTRVRITFDEPVQLKNAKISTASGAAVKAFRLNDDGLELIVELNEKLRAEDALVLDGLYDRAREPNALADNLVPVSCPPWPGNRAGLIFLWEVANTSNFCIDSTGDAFRPVTLTMLGPARLDRFGSMSLRGGMIYTPRASDGVFLRCGRTNELSVEATIAPAAAQQGDIMNPAQIIACNAYRRGKEMVNFALTHEGDGLAFYLRAKPAGVNDPLGSLNRVRLCSLPADTLSHVVVSYASGELACYLNGKKLMRTDEVSGALTWGKPRSGVGIEFGGGIDGKAVKEPWKGKLEGIAIYDRAITADEVRDNYAEYAKKLAARKPLPQIEVEVSLVAKSDIPSTDDIAPYHSALVVCEYDVKKVLKGKYEEKKLRVAHWGLVYKKPTPIARAKPGHAAILTLEKFSDHSELGAEFLSDTLPEDFDLTLYVDPTVPDAAAGGPTTSTKGKLSLAKSYLAAGLKDKARAILVEIVEKHPNSKDAPQARKLLEKVGSED